MAQGQAFQIAAQEAQQGMRVAASACESLPVLFLSRDRLFLLTYYQGHFNSDWDITGISLIPVLAPVPTYGV